VSRARRSPPALTAPTVPRGICACWIRVRHVAVARHQPRSANAPDDVAYLLYTLRLTGGPKARWSVTTAR
jgi:hypothetical protein